MIVTIGGVSLRITPADDWTAELTNWIGLGAHSRLHPFISRGKRVFVDLTVRRVDQLSWEEILTPEDALSVRDIVRKIEGRFPFSALPFRGVDRHRPRPKAGAVSMPLLAAFGTGDISVIPHPGFLLAVDHRLGHADAVVKVEDGWDGESSLLLLLQGVLALCAPDYGALMIHAASLALGGAGYLFVGGSGAGKSTIAASAGSEGVLSDDGSWCSKGDGGFSLFPTPFSQTDPAPGVGGPVPLKRILFLEKGVDNRLVDISPGRAMIMLLSNHIHFFRFMGRHAALKAFDLVVDLFRGSPASTLVFTKDFMSIPFFRGVADERKRQEAV
jgi:hypothetical protein